MITEEARSYEVSLWTLQDEFITVLKWSDVEQQGRIRDPKMILNVDGTQTFSFSIPMYLQYHVDEPEPHLEMRENPIWYNTKNGNLIASMRKVKVIFNKNKVILDENRLSQVFKDIYLPPDYNGNTNLFNRKLVGRSAFIAAGYTNFTGNYGTIYSGSYSYRAKDGKTYDVIYTPILANGTVKSTNEVQAYLQQLISQNTYIDQWLANDRAQNNLILSIFPVNADHHSSWAEDLHNRQAEWDQVRAHYGLINNEDNLANITLSEPNYYYYFKSVRPHSTFEFLITKVTESHENDQLICNVECEGLAFNELGKIGYKYTLNLDEVMVDQKKLEKINGINATIHPTVDYWAEKIGLVPYDSTTVVQPNIWYYQILMNWDSFAEDNNARQRNKVYEEEYTSSWTVDNNDNIIPRTVERYREKERIIEAKESNIYNITQTIAETFEIFCRYEYDYDDNYHIISKKVIFYNNFISEEDGFSSITYPYDAKSISRNMDSTNLTTKLYIQSSDVDDTVMGSNSIILSEANKTKEDYLLDFDYVHRINGINDEQYQAIAKYEADILKHNNEIIPLQEKRDAIQRKIIDLKARQKIYANSVELDDKQTDMYKKKLEAYDKIDQMVNGKISITETAPKMKVLITEDAENHTYSLNLGDQDKGIDPGSIKVFRTWNAATGKCFGQFVDYVPKFSNEDNILIGLEHLRYAPTTFNASDIAENGANCRAWVLGADPTTPPTSGWTEVETNDDFPAVNSFSVAEKAATPFYWKNNYTVYKNGYIHNVYEMECLNTTEVFKNNIKRYVVKKEPIYFYKNDKTPPTVPTEVVTENRPNTGVWTTGLRNYEEGVYCYITYQYEYRVFVTVEELDGNQGISSTSTAPSNQPVYDWLPKTAIIDSKYNEQPSSSFVYVTYDYFPKLYYDKLIQFWADKSNADQAEAARLSDILGDEEAVPKTKLYKEYDDIESQLEAAIEAKNITIRAFERMMGPALREGYWSPDNYEDYGETHTVTDSLNTSYTSISLSDANAITPIIGWDDQLFEDEDDYYYKTTANLTHINYPCINLKAVYNNNTVSALQEINTLLQSKEANEGIPGFIYSDSNCRNLSNSVITIDNDAMPNTITNDGRDPKYVRLFALDSEAILAFGVYNNEVVPILILTGAKMLSDDAITNMKSTGEKGGNPVIGLFNYTHNNGKITINISNSVSVENENTVWITPEKIVYPRIRIRSDAIQTTEDKLSLSYGDNKILTNNEDYKVAFRTNIDDNDNYYNETCITLKNHIIFNGGSFPKNITIKYTLSNANTSIYLDAYKVLKENSIPKASYEVSIGIVNQNFIKDLYNRLTSILMINDAELKFENVFGYISQVELYLDACYKDVIEVKNYKTKFEDLFSTIVAQTEAMKKNGGIYAAAAAGQVGLSEKALEETLANNKNIFDAYWESGFDGREIVEAKLASVANEIGLILGAANESLDRLYGLTLENTNILSGFVENIAEDLTPRVYYGTTPPEKARTGDVFYQTDPETGEIIGNWLGNTNGGYTKTFDGQLSQITGATMNVDAEKGIIEILAGTKIDMKTGGDLYIAAKENINIVGNKSVNIGGGAINIAALASENKGISIVAVREGDALIASKVYELLLSKIKKSTNYVESDFTNSNGQNKDFADALKLDAEPLIRSINGNKYRFDFGDGIIYEVAKTSLENSGTFSYVKAYKWLSQKVTTTSLVDIKPKQIMMKSSNLIMKASSKILLVASDGTMEGTSALQLSPSEGIFMGSGKGITLFAGKTSGQNGALIDYDDANQKISLKDGTVLGSTFQLKPNYLIFGTAQLTSDADTETGTVMEITQKHLVFGVSEGPLKVYSTTSGSHMIGDIQNRPNINISYNTDITGVEITKDKIGFATNSVLKDREGTSLNISVRNLFLMNNEGIMLGAIKANTSLTGDSLFNNKYRTDGSYIIISPTLIEIGSLGNLYINTNNFKLQTDSYEERNGQIVSKTTLDNTIMAIGNDLQSIDADSAYNLETGRIEKLTITNNVKTYTAYNTAPNVDLVLNKNGLYIKGVVYASAGSFTGDVTAKRLNATGGLNSNGYGPIFSVDGAYLGIFKLDSNLTSLPTLLENVPDANKLLWFNSSTGDLYIKGRLRTAGVYVDDTLWDTYWTNVKNNWMSQVNTTLTDLFNEAGEIIGAAARSLKDVQDLNGANNTILTSFYEDISTKLTPNTSKGPYHEYYFKTGDIWEKTAITSGQTNLDENGNQKAASSNPYNSSTVIATYIAMSDWDKVYNENKSSAVSGKDSTNGWNRIQDGRIASLEGAKLDVDAKSGTISLKAGSKIELLAKSLIDISSQELELTASYARDTNNDFILDGNGNKIGGKINISGEASVNIASGGSINLVTSSTYNGTKAIKIDKDGIVIASAAQIEIKSSKGIYIKSSTDSSANVIEISETNGVWIGSEKAVNLSSTASEVKGANFSMTPERILIGVTKVDDTNNASATAIDMNSKEIIIAAGNKLQSLQPDGSGNITNIEATDISGIQIKSDYIGMATGSGANRSLISLASSKILIGVGTLSDGVPSGSYVRIENDTTNHTSTFEIGSTGIFKVLTPDFYVATDNTQSDIFRVGNTSGPYIAYNPNNEVNDTVIPILTVKGNIQATSFQLDGEIENDATNGLGTINWGKNYDWPGIDNISIGHAKKMITLSTDYKGGLLIRGGSLVIPFTSTLSAANEGPFETPALLLNETGFSYRYFPDNQRSSSNPIAESILQINKDGINLTGSSIAVYSGDITINGSPLWGKNDIIYSATEPTNHPEHDWVWIKPNSTLMASATFTFPGNTGETTNATKNTSTQFAGPAITAAQLTYSVSARVKFFTALNGNFTLTVTITDGTNSINTSIDFGGIFTAQLGIRTASATISNAANIFNTANHQLNITLVGSSGNYYPQDISIVASIDSGNATGSRIPCEVYYFS